MQQSNTKAYLAWISVCIVWGTTYLAIRIGVTDLPPFLFTGIRWITAGPIFLTFFLLKGYTLPKLKDLKHIAIVGILLIGMANSLVVVAEQWIPSGLTSLLITTMPFWVVGIELFIPSSPKFNIKIISGIFLGFAGVLIIFWSEIENLINPNYFFGITCIMGSVMAWASGSLYSKYKKVDSHPLINASLQMIIAGLLQISVGFILGEGSKFHLTTNSLLAIVYLLFVGSIMGYGSFIYAISHLPVSFVITYSYINPIIALFLGWFILDEKLTVEIILGALIIFSGVALVQWGNKKRI